MKCPYCGEELLEEDMFCGKCGKKVVEEVVPVATIGDKIKDIKRQMKQEREEKQKQRIEKAQKELEEKKREEEIKQFAYELYIENEGNEFKVIKGMKDKYGFDDQKAMQYLNFAEMKYKYERNQGQIDNGSYKIKSTKIVATNDRTKSKYSLTKGTIGWLAMGPLGLFAGKGVDTKSTTTFLVEYYNGKTDTVTVKNDSMQYSKYCKYLKD